MTAYNEVLKMDLGEALNKSVSLEFDGRDCEFVLTDIYVPGDDLQELLNQDSIVYGFRPLTLSCDKTPLVLKLTIATRKVNSLVSNFFHSEEF